MVQVISLTRPLSDSCEDWISTMGLGNVVNEFLDKHCFSDTCSSEQSNFSTSRVRSQQIHHLDSCYQDFSSTSLIFKGRSFSVNRVVLFSVQWTSFINWFSNHIHNSAKSFRANWNSNWTSGIFNILSSNQTFSRVHGNSSHSGVT